MKTPWTMRSAVNTMRSGATASSAVGIESSARLRRMPRRRLMRRLKKATASPAIAMPIVLALTANPIAAGLTR